MFSPNIKNAYDDIASGRAHEYRETWKYRASLIAESKQHNINRLEFSAMHDVPNTIYFSDLAPDPYWWPNTYYAKHMGIGAVRTADGEPWPESPLRQYDHVAPLGK